MKTICFLGDSITRRGYWVAEIFAHLRGQGVRVYNCGVSGDSASGAIARLYTDCLSRTPHTVVMMFGMNDVGRNLYDEGAGDQTEKKQARLEKYQKSIRTLSEMIRAAGIELILCTPTPYNDVTESDLPKCSVNDGLAACAEIVREYAAEIGVPCIDFFSYLRPMVGTGYTTLPDLVHPTPEGHHPMAQFFMKEMGMIDAIDETPFLPMDAEAQARFDVEQRAREIEFIEWNLMYGERTRRKMTRADFIALARLRLADAEIAGDERKIKWYSWYLTYSDNKLEYEDELVRRTLLYAAKNK